MSHPFNVGLDALTDRGWVHRDISVGNVLVVGQQVKIADVEYAKMLADPSTVCVSLMHLNTLGIHVI